MAGTGLGASLTSSSLPPAAMSRRRTPAPRQPDLSAGARAPRPRTVAPSPTCAPPPRTHPLLRPPRPSCPRPRPLPRAAEAAELQPGAWPSLPTPSLGRVLALELLAGRETCTVPKPLLQLFIRDLLIKGRISSATVRTFSANTSLENISLFLLHSFFVCSNSSMEKDAVKS